MKIKKIVWIVDVLLVGAILLTALWLIGYTHPRVIFPIDNLISDENSVIFSINKGEFILIDDNIEFSSPEQVFVKDGAIINLNPGIYYWKIKTNGINEIRKLTILSKIDLKIIKSGDAFSLVNGGNLPLNVEVYDNQEKINNFELSVSESKESNGTKFIGAQNG